MKNSNLLQKRDNLIKRQKIIAAIRRSFENKGFLEVETPIRIPSPAPELNINPTKSDGRFLIASPELQMKRLISAGYKRIFQITKCFRNDESGKKHLPEFTMLEWYETGGTLNSLINDCKEIITYAAKAVDQYPEIKSNMNHSIILNKKWPLIEIQDAYKEAAG